MRGIFLGIKLSLILLLISTPSFATIFGTDDRVEVYTQPFINQNISPAVAVMVSPVFMQETPSGFIAEFNSSSDSFEVGLCPDQRFYNQPTASVSCTGFLVAPDILLTAGHCAVYADTEVRNTKTPQCSDFDWVFDFKYTSKNKIDLLFPLHNVAKCQEVLWGKLQSVKKKIKSNLYGDDFALIKLDRPFARPYLKVATNTKTTSVYALGHPNGLPQKAALNGRIISNFNNYITSTLDIFDGNSGSPMITKDTNEAIGIIVRSFPYRDYDYDEKTQCAKPVSCNEDLNNCKILKSQDPLEEPYSHAQKINQEMINVIFNNTGMM